MLIVFRKIFVTAIVILMVLSTGAWQSSRLPAVKSQNPGVGDPPLYPGITWLDNGKSNQNIRVNVNGDFVSVPGNRYVAQEEFPFQLPAEVLNYYSVNQLAQSGWESYDSYENEDGSHLVFFHESGYYLSVSFLKCSDIPTNICVAIWVSEQVKPLETTPGVASNEATPGAEAASTFGKKSPADGATTVNPIGITLSWQAYSPTPEKYTYCLLEGTTCDSGWTSTYSTSSPSINKDNNKTYSWQVRALICGDCNPKKFVYADNGDVWTFKTAQNKVGIVGNAGVGGAVLSYTDGTAKTVTADSTGAYAISIPINWSGTVTPSKSGYLFNPKSATFSNLTAAQTIQNFAATVTYVISGNAGQAGVTLSYTNVTPQTVTSDANGNYSFSVPTGWSGTVIPSKSGYLFNPTSRTYTNLSANQSNQNYTATYITYTISGSVGVPGTTLTYTNGTPLFVVADGSGNYSITLPMGWSGTITPHEIGYSFSPASTSYTNLQSNFTNQNYTPAVCPSCADQDTVGVFRPTNGLIYLKNENITGYADVSINYGLGGDYPVAGDWDGNGTATIGVYRNGSFYLRNENSVGYADVVFPFGSPGDQPIAGDWDGDGKDTIGVYRTSTFTFYLRNSNTEGPADYIFQLGIPGDVGIAGDWTNKGFDTVGVFRPSNGVIYLKNTNVTGFADISINYGIGGDKPVTGDWDNNGTDTIGVLRGNVFYLRNSNTVGFADITFALGLSGDMPIAGNWDDRP